MSVTVLLTVKAKPENYNDLKAAIAEALKTTKAFKGCLGIYASGNPGDHSVLVYERWENIDAYKAYAEWRKSNGGLQDMAAWFREPPKSVPCEDVFS